MPVYIPVLILWHTMDGVSSHDLAMYVKVYKCYIILFNLQVLKCDFSDIRPDNSDQ